MHRRPLMYGLGCLALMLVASAHAEDEYWISVGSYRQLSAAEQARSDASIRLPESFSVTSVELDSGTWFRVLAGPYLTREIADHMLDEATKQGFEAAWILSIESGFVSPLYSVDPQLEYSDYDADYPSLDLPPPNTSDDIDYQLPERSDEAKDYKLIDEAPADYQLNKLNRDQTRIDWLSPFLLATNEASIISAALAAQAQAVQPSGSVAIDLHQQEPFVLQQWEHQQADIKIDGNLDEEAWQHAMAVEQLKVTEPDTLVDPLYRTEVRLFYTEKGVYVSFDMEQPADTLVKRLSSRDDRDIKRDYVSFTLDTSGSARYGYWMSLALGDNQLDGTMLPEREYSSNWDGAWWGATTEHDRGWSAEFFVPWSQMSMPKQDGDGSRRIGFYSSRAVAHLNERWAWPPLPRSQPKFMSAFRSLEVTDVNPRQQWSLFPYASSTSNFAADESRFKAGMDMFWRPATNTQLTATINPDFGTVESDEVIVNLTAFETFFPEKRLFFLEGREIFEASQRAGGWDPITLLNTRRIGSSPRRSAEDDHIGISPVDAGHPTELYGAGKVTGQIGAFRYGVLTAFEQDTTLHGVDAVDGLTEIVAPGRDFAIGRLLYENNASGIYRALGVMTTLTAHPDEDTATAGVDYHYLSKEGTWKVDGQFLHSDLDLSGSGSGGFVDMEYAPRQGMKYQFEYTYLDRKVDLNDAGFMRRNDKTGGRIGNEWIKSGFSSFRDLKIETFLRYEENLDGYPIRSGIGGEGDFTLNNLHSIDFGIKYFPARYDDRNSFGNGTYRITERPSFELGYDTDRSKAVSAYVFSRWEGDGVDGKKLESKLGLNWRPIDRVNFELSTFYRVREGWLLHQEGQNMTAFDAEEWQPEFKLDFFLSARQEFRMKLQWVGIKAFEDRFYEIPGDPGDLVEVDKPTDESDDFSVSAMNFQLRYRWQIAPLSDVFLVYTRNGFDNSERASFQELFQNAWNDPLGEHLVLKVRYRMGS